MSPPAIALPPPGDGGLAALLSRRRSTRRFDATPPSLDDVGHLLWAAYGRHATGRTVPSAHALHPLEVVLVTGPSEDLPPATYRYDPLRHHLDPAAAGDHRGRIAAAALVDAEWLATAPALIVVGADLAALGRHFADRPAPATRGPRYAWTEFGHLAQNVYLQAAELGLGAVVVAGVDDGALTAALVEAGGPRTDPLGVLAVGRPAP